MSAVPGDNMCSSSQSYLQPPVADKKTSSKRIHDTHMHDDYSWLEDKDNPEVIAFLEANNQHVDQALAHLAPLRETIFHEIKSRTKETDMSLPVRRGQWWFYTRTQEGKNYARHYRLRVSNSDDWTPPEITDDPLPGEQLLIDVNELAQGHDFFSLGTLSMSDDGTLLAYATDTQGNERYDLVVKNLETGQFLPDTLKGIAAGAFFSLDARYIFYITVDEAWRPETIWRHTLGTPVEEDTKIYHEPDERFWMGIGYTRSKKYALIEVGSKTTSEVLVCESNDPGGNFRSLWGRVEDREYTAEHLSLQGKDYFLYIHNHEAENFRLAYSECTPNAPVINLGEYNPAHRLESIDAFDRYAVLSYRTEGVPHIAIASLDQVTHPSELNFVPVCFDSPLISAGLSLNPDPQTPTLRIGYTSFTEPSTIIALDVPTGQRTILRQQEVLGGYDPNHYRSARHYAQAEDGTRIPISLVYRADLTFPAPTLLYGYGSYESTIDPYFSIARLSLLDRGIVFAIAHVRGGGELGRSWYTQGKMLNKRNTFTDFIASAHYLKDSGIATNIVAEGGSAGGLLVGAVANMEPELFAGILAIVPFVDTLNTILDPSLPLTITEWEEWGNPLHDPHAFNYIHTYSPYENVTPQPYPEILAITSLNDTRVRYSEPVKWVAKLRENTTSGKPVYVKTELVAGHGGASGRYKKWEEIAFEHAWVIEVLGALGALGAENIAY